MKKLNILMIMLITSVVFMGCEKETQEHADAESKPQKVQSTVEGWAVDTLSEESDVYQLFEQSEMYSYIEDDLENKSYHILLHTNLEEEREVLELQMINPENYDEKFFGVEVDSVNDFDHLNGWWITKNFNNDDWDTKVTITHFPNDESYAEIYNMDDTDEAQLDYTVPGGGGNGSNPSYNDCVDQCMHDELNEIFEEGSWIEQALFIAGMPYSLTKLSLQCGFECM